MPQRDAAQHPRMHTGKHQFRLDHLETRVLGPAGRTVIRSADHVVDANINHPGERVSRRVKTRSPRAMMLPSPTVGIRKIGGRPAESRFYMSEDAIRQQEDAHLVRLRFPSGAPVALRDMCQWAR